MIVENTHLAAVICKKKVAGCLDWFWSSEARAAEICRLVWPLCKMRYVVIVPVSIQFCESTRSSVSFSCSSAIVLALRPVYDETYNFCLIECNVTLYWQ